MTRWLAAAQRASEARTKPTKLTKLPAPEVLSEKSVLSEAREPIERAAPDDPRARLDAARARVARLSDADGIARTDAAIEAVWDEAEALARARHRLTNRV
jgi:hypothetical protein